MNHEPPDVQASVRKGRGTRDQLPTSAGSQKKEEFQKNIYFCFIDYVKASDCVQFSSVAQSCPTLWNQSVVPCLDHNKLWKILKEMGIPDHLTCLLRNLYADQEATVRTGHGITDWFQIEKEYIKAVYSHPDYLACMQSAS